MEMSIYWLGILTITLRVCISWYLLSFAEDGLDGNDLQLEKNGQFFQVLPMYFGQIAKTLFINCFSLDRSLNIVPPVLYE